MVLNDGANEDFVRFAKLIPKESLPTVATILKETVRDHARSISSDTDLKLEEALEKFFRLVSADTNRNAPYSNSTEYFTNMIKAWVKGRGPQRTFLLETYFFLHRSSGRDIAVSIDKEIFGRIYFDQSARPLQNAGRGETSLSNTASEAGWVSANETTALAMPTLTEHVLLDIRPPSRQPRLTIPSRSHHQSHYSNMSLKVLGRTREKENLARFLSRGNGFRWLQIAGVGGQGKSRLAYDLVTDCDEEWESGFLKKEHLASFKPYWEEWVPTKPHLIVIDYVVGSESEIGIALGILARRSSELDVAVRVILLERQRWNSGGVRQSPISANASVPAAAPLFSHVRADWFDRVNRASGCDDIADEEYRFESGAIELIALESDHLVTIVREAAALNGIEITQSPNVIKAFLARIDGSGRPLYAYFLAEALGSGRFQPHWDNSTLLQFVLDNDREKRWASYFPEAPILSDADPALGLALLATMVRVVDCTTLASSPDWEPTDGTIRRQALALTAGHIAGGVSGPGQIITGLEPDILGEFFVLSALHEGNLLQPLSEAAWSLAPQEMAAFLLRTVQDFPDHVSVNALLSQTPPSAEAQSAYAMVASDIVAYLTRSNRSFPDEVGRQLRHAAHADNRTAMNNLGICYQHGRGFQANRDEALNWFQKAAQAGDATAMTNVGLCYQYALGIGHDMDKSLDWYRRGAEAGCNMAMFNMGICHEHEFGVEKNIALAVAWFHKAAELGNGMAMAKLGTLYYTDQYANEGVRQDYASALEWFGRGAVAGDSGAMHNLATCHLQGNGTKVDLDQVMIWFNRAADLGVAASMVSIGAIHYEAEHFAEAVNWFSRGARAGDSGGMTNWGICYQQGHISQEQFSEDILYMLVGTEEGNGVAMTWLGLCYCHGWSLEIDINKADDLLSRAVAAGYEDARRFL